MIHSINFLTVVILPIGFILVQIFLSKNDNKYAGFIIPGLNFLFSIVVSIQAFNIMQMIHAFIMCNIMTVVTLIILYICRRNIKRKSQINKMNIQDLE